MDHRIHELLILAQQARFDRGMTIFKWGLTTVGVAILIVALGVYLSKPKDQSKELSPVVKIIVLVGCLVLGVGSIGYAWLGF